MSARKKLATRAALLVATLAIADQLVQHVALRDGTFLGRRIAPFDPPIFCAEQQAALERLRAHATRGTPLAGDAFDAELGWCPRPSSGDDRMRFDRAGVRVATAELARERDPARRRVVCVGDSFTLGAEVLGDETWEAEFERLRPELELANLGVSGYGADQALLRLERDGLALHPDEVWFAIVPCNAHRCVTTYLPAWRHWGPMLAVKPRFELDDDAMTLVPPPARTAAELVALVEDASRFAHEVAPHDAFVRAHPIAYAPCGSSLLHSSGLARLALTWMEKNGRDPAPELADPSSELHRLLRAIVLRARDASDRAGARFRLLVLPDRASPALRGGEDYARALLDDLRARGVDVIDATGALRAAGGADDASLWMPGGHYSARGNAVIARALAELVAEKR